MSRLSDLVGRLRALIHGVQDASVPLKGARDQVEQATSIVAASTVGSSNALVTDGLGHLRTAQEKIEEAQALLAAGSQTMEQYVQGPLGGGSGGDDGTPLGPPTPTTASPDPKRPWSSRPPVPDFHPDRPNATCIEQTRRVGWPLNDGGKISARGRLYDTDGRAVTDTVQAGNGPARNATDVAEPWASDQRMTTRWHIEGHTAALMRRHRLQQAVLYLNILPCGKAARDQWRCHENLPKLLPKGSALTVWIVHRNGMHEKIRYQGTGEALR